LLEKIREIMHQRTNNKQLKEFFQCLKSLKTIDKQVNAKISEAWSSAITNLEKMIWEDHEESLKTIITKMKSGSLIGSDISLLEKLLDTMTMMKDMEWVELIIKRSGIMEIHKRAK